MSLRIEAQSNIDEVIRQVEEQLPRQATHVLAVLNEAPYAKYLHDRVGYSVLNDFVAQRYTWAALVEATEQANAAGRILSDDDIIAALEKAADQIVAYYQQVIGVKNTAGTVRPPPRKMHPGMWADDTLELVRSYLTAVDDGPEKRYPYHG